MKAPDVIYLAESDKVKGEVSSNFVSENPFKTHTSIAYIRKEALLEWAKQKQYDSETIVQDDFWQEVIDKLNEM